MPLDRPTHWNPPDEKSYERFIGKTRDGYKLSKVKWTKDISDVTCNRCQYLEKTYG